VCVFDHVAKNMDKDYYFMTDSQKHFLIWFVLISQVQSAHVITKTSHRALGVCPTACSKEVDTPVRYDSAFQQMGRVPWQRLYRVGEVASKK
jgi:hypothetical protein